jgi:carbon monoxide dehydrogenase subunit G
MKVAGDHTFRANREQVWDALNDPQILAATLPGARRLDPTGPDEYALTVDVGVGSVKGTYEGTFALTDKQERESCTGRASASGRPGSVTAVASMRLSDDGQGARMSYEADANVTGPLAGVGQRLMGAAARRTTEQFLAALDERIVSGAPAPDEAAAAPAPGEAVPGRALVPAAPAPAGARAVVAGALAGAAIALIGVAVGRWTTRR